VRLSAYGGDASDLPAAVLQSTLDRIADGTFPLWPTTVYRIDRIHQAHHDMETNAATGKLVVLTAADTTRA
jgi:NADPH:quinone reductase